MKPSTVLVDADLLCYISYDPDEPAEYVLNSVKLMLEGIQEGTQCTSMRVLLSSPKNFRYDVDPEYKCSRKDTPKPPHYLTIKKYLKVYFGAEVSPDGFEADDYIAQIMIQEGDSVCVASTDKDFLTVKGWHYKFRHHNAGELFYVDDDDAEAFLCYQLLTGDSADDIISPLKKLKKDGTYGKAGFGHVAARDFILEHNDFSTGMLRAHVESEYIKQGFHDDFFKNYKLLAIGRCVET